MEALSSSPQTTATAIAVVEPLVPNPHLFMEHTQPLAFGLLLAITQGSHRRKLFLSSLYITIEFNYFIRPCISF